MGTSAWPVKEREILQWYKIGNVPIHYCIGSGFFKSRKYGKEIEAKSIYTNLTHQRFETNIIHRGGT